MYLRRCQYTLFPYTTLFRSLGGGEVIAIPTETVYGLAALPLSDSVERLIAAKQRSNEKGIQLLVDSIDQVRAVCELPPDRKSTRLNSSHLVISYAVSCLQKK